ncbi:hypothetical protein [Sphaerisporangium siamense]|uniref:Uncharacterized protein n=1 Tax=Sphaerisporangium siamense TaxID=795645 RepID=A0A7W7D752_9ACTN|nr:hypothetical protein [Sphaerisporangium siamense]MBB4700098.1 hypothetical protein [Sphaerisporangium siamense]
MAARKIHIHTQRGRGFIEVDGKNAKGIRGFTVQGTVNDWPTATLDVILFEAEIDGKAYVDVPEKTRDTLIALGWTPPGEPSEIAALPTDPRTRPCCPYGSHGVNEPCRHADGRPVRMSEQAEIRARYPLD